MAQKQVLSLPRRISVSETARRLGVSREIIPRLVEQGELETFPIPGGTKATIVEASVEAFIRRMLERNSSRQAS